MSAANARRLLEFADRGSKCRKYGPAIALCVLASEEGAKAFALLAEAISPEPMWLADVLSRHKTKHNISGISSLMLHLISLTRQIKDEIQAEVDNGTFNGDRPASRFVSRVVQELQHMTNDPEDRETRFATWYRGANKLKQDGFYVDWKGSDWHDPDSATAKEFGEYRSYVEWWLDRVDDILAVPIEEFASALAQYHRLASSNMHGAT